MVMANPLKLFCCHSHSVRFARVSTCAITALLLACATADAQRMSPLPPGQAAGTQAASVGTGLIGLCSSIGIAAITGLLHTKTSSSDSTTLTGAQSGSSGNSRTFPNVGPLLPSGAAESVAAAIQAGSRDGSFSEGAFTNTSGVLFLGCSTAQSVLSY
jgi:hypothetical protein